MGIAFAAKRIAVQIDPRVEKVKDHLAHAHCGACGYAGCEQYAEAVVNKPEVAPNLCIPAGAKGAEAVALTTGKKAEIREPRFARLCARVQECREGNSNTKASSTAGPRYWPAEVTSPAPMAVSATAAQGSVRSMP
jgi:Na+-translocating ferredoxin:NAD+ oxidoreductase RNF subunit RnfB